MNIRNANADDAGQLAEIYNYYVVNTHITFDVLPVSEDNRRHWIAQYNQRPEHRLIVGEVNGDIIGYASSSQFRGKPAYDRSVETTIYLAQNQQGHGYGPRLYDHLLSELHQTIVNRCYGVVALPNEASIALHKKYGFREVGRLSAVGFKFDRYWDTVFLEKTMD